MSHILESGKITFFFQPKTEDTDRESKLCFQLRSDASDTEASKVRWLVMGHPELPAFDALGGSKPAWGFVDPHHALLETQEFALAEGHYFLSVHEDHSHFAYRLLKNPKRRTLCASLHLEVEGSYLISVKNPWVACPAGAGLPRELKARYPLHLQRSFGEKRFLPLNSAEYLEHKGAEVLLISSAECFPQIWPALNLSLVKATATQERG